MNISANFYSPTAPEWLFMGLLFFWYVAMCLFALYIVVSLLLFISGKVLHKDLSVKSVFLTKRAKHLYGVLVPLLIVVLIGMWAYFGLIDN